MIRKILAYVKEYKAASIATPCFMILEVIMEMIVPYLMATLVDDGINAQHGHLFERRTVVERMRHGLLQAGWQRH